MIPEEIKGQAWRLSDTLDEVHKRHIQIEDMYGRHIVLCDKVYWRDYEGLCEGIRYEPVTLDLEENKDE